MALSGCALVLMAGDDAHRWPAFAAAALAVGVHAEFSLPLNMGPAGRSC
jgi:hypothetical protein